jgi:hypothetical protein
MTSLAYAEICYTLFSSSVQDVVYEECMEECTVCKVQHTLFIHFMIVLRIM